MGCGIVGVLLLRVYWRRSYLLLVIHWLLLLIGLGVVAEGWRRIHVLMSREELGGRRGRGICRA